MSDYWPSRPVEYVPTAIVIGVLVGATTHDALVGIALIALASVMFWGLTAAVRAAFA